MFLTYINSVLFISNHHIVSHIFLVVYLDVIFVEKKLRNRIMEWINTIFSKIETMRTTTIGLANTNCTESTVANSSTIYNTHFSSLVTAINGYINNSSARTQNLMDMITFDFIYQLRKNLTYSPDVVRTINISNAPLGSNDYTLLFNIDGLANTILSASNDYFYDGCINAGGTPPTLVSAIEQATQAESNEIIKRENLINFYRTTAAYNGFIFLVEIITTSGNIDSKPPIGNDIYMNKNAKEIIDALSLDIYIPSYIS